MLEDQMVEVVDFVNKIPQQQVMIMAYISTLACLVQEAPERAARLFEEYQEILSLARQKDMSYVAMLTDLQEKGTLPIQYRQLTELLISMINFVMGSQKDDSTS
jgi:hypothetical protein